MEEKILMSYKYKQGIVDKGYTNRTLYVNVSTNEIKEKPVTDYMKEKFVGGRGFGMYYLWEAVKPTTKWNDPENDIIISGGPCCGITQYPGSGKSIVCSISPMTDIPMDCNVGGYFGPLMKFAGFDAIELQGKADKDVYVYIDGENCEVKILEATDKENDSHTLGEILTERYAKDENDKRNVACVLTGSAAEHVLMAMLNFTFYDTRRKVARLKQAGRGGLGRVFRDKKIKALIVRYPIMKGDLNHPADMKKLKETGVKMHKEIHDEDTHQNHMRMIGTANTLSVLPNYDLVPCLNYQYGTYEGIEGISSETFINKYLTQGIHDGCWYGCTLSCAKCADNFEITTGPYKGQKVTVDGPEYENAAGLGANCGIFDARAVLELNFYCDTYGIDIISYATATAFVMECYHRGILDKEKTGGLELDFGNAAASLELLHQMSRGEGFGLIAGLGIHKMKDYFVEHFGADRAFLDDIGMECKGLEYSEYMPKESLAQQGGFALTNKGPQHDEAWLIFMDMVNNAIPTFEDKADALYFYPMFRTWFGLYGFCKLVWNDIVPADNSKTSEPAKVPGHIENYINVVEAVTGKKYDLDTLIRESERIYQFQHIFNLRMGHGTRKDDKPPYRSVGPVTKEEYESRQDRYDKQLKELCNYDPAGKSTEEKIKKMREYRMDQFEKLTDAVYKRRGWTKDGIPTIERLKEIGMDLPELVELIKPYQK